MADSMNLNVRISGALKDHVTLTVSEGDYENVSEYVRDLIRKDKREREAEAFAALRAELQLAFAQPDEDYQLVTKDEIIALAAERLGKAA
jgi:putative addiction module CopG family antidote